MKTIKFLPLLSFITVIFAATSCTDFTIDDLKPSDNAQNFNQMVAPTNFKWTTTQIVTINLIGQTTSAPIESTLSIEGLGGSYFKSLYKESNKQTLKLTIPSNEKNLTLKFNSQEQKVVIASGKADVDFSKFTTPSSASIQKRTTSQIDARDQDEDGVADRDDDYPTDPNKAYNNYFPSKNSTGTLAFEDNWPTKGDYDFNDVVVDYNLNTVTNSRNKIVEVIGQFTLKASGATYSHGFGFQLDNINNNQISSVSGSNLSSGSYISLNPRGLENGQTSPNCIVFDNFFDLIPKNGTGVGVNTEKASQRANSKTITMTIKFIDNGIVPAGGAIDFTDLQISGYNFYIISNRNREIEVHLPDRRPTDLANRSYLGKGDDDSAGSSRFYKTQSNLPWALNVVQGFDYPVEHTSIENAYLHLIRWAESSGSEFSDWYDSKTGYRQSSLIY
ncbi:MAG: LruC domain-containing protein [Bacteroidales bacterium]|nr:LruC domain-containing protein [Bacteroidales bacterium]